MSDQIELQLDQSQLPYSEYLGPIPQEAAQPDITKKAHYTGQKQYRRRSKTSLRRSQGHDTMGRALFQISHSPFSQHIEQADLPCCFNQPTFTIYDGTTNLVEHVSHFNQRMAIHSKNKALMCKIFPSNLGPVVMRRFDSLEEGSIHSFEELTKAFGARFVTCSRVLRP